MHFSSWALCFWLLATPAPQVLSVQIQYDITGSGDFMQAPKVLDFDFGGDKHGVDSQGDYMRPEAVKTQVCEEPSSKCSDCTTKASCWRGSNNVSAISKSGKPIKDKGKLGSLKLDVSASATANYYAAEMWATCGNGNGKWRMVFWLDTIVNGVITIFVDGSRYGPTIRGKATPQQVKRKIVVAKNTRVRVLFERLTAGQVASALVKLKAVGVDEYVDECMGVTNCLVALGDGSESAVRFRNSNVLQFACLVASSSDKRDAVSDHCNVWETCVSSSGAAPKLKALLGAALTPHGSLAEGEINMQKLNDAEGCVDPSVEDAESWDCECMDEMTTSCEGVNEECFNKILCGNSNVCESWKSAHCGALLLAEHKTSIKASQNKSALLTRRGTKRAIANVDDRLDIALSGKCSQ